MTITTFKQTLPLNNTAQQDASPQHQSHQACRKQRPKGPTSTRWLITHTIRTPCHHKAAQSIIGATSERQQQSLSGLPEHRLP